VRKLPPDSATGRAELGDRWDWGHLAANVAELVDLMSFWLQQEYARWTVDPNDPEVKRAKKTKPPPIPLVAPVAHRPPSVAAEYEEQFAGLVAAVGAKPESARERAEKRWVSSAEFDAAIEAM
jgi:hypothetical protein